MHHVEMFSLSVFLQYSVHTMESIQILPTIHLLKCAVHKRAYCIPQFNAVNLNFYFWRCVFDVAFISVSRCVCLCVLYPAVFDVIVFTGAV